VSEPEAVELGFLNLEELPNSERTWGVSIPEYLATPAEREVANEISQLAAGREALNDQRSGCRPDGLF
jgi:hypothetical protein